ncbi:MAG: DUF4159 domain-containing protein [Leptolyngbyaceae cyanobacterium SL_7_1]|nr:DUF4159 domain-containing protein [Leptolyngbyaceae cyanobacterium SL_7_1]
MNATSFPTPAIIPLERLHVYDSLMMNAQRWSLAHDYHRRRQNIHYQSLNQPGIVCGLGVSLTEPPETTRSEFRDDRWIKIQPGIAIDVEGNVIVVDEIIDRTYRIAAKRPTTGTLTIYVVVSYVEPQPIDRQHPEILQEQFRFDQKTSPPDDHEIELCRIQLAANFVQLETPSDVFFPQSNQLNFNHRLQAQTRPLATIGMAEIQPYPSEPTDACISRSLPFLSQATIALYPKLHCFIADRPLPINAHTSQSFDLLYLAASHLTDLSASEQDLLNQHLEAGGTLVMELPLSNEFAIAHLHDCIADLFRTSLTVWSDLPVEHPLRSQPFLFAALPELEHSPLQLWSGGGIVLMAGALTAAWAPDPQGLRSRDHLRTTQELGINLLQFAWQRRHLTQLSIDPAQP